MLINIVHLTLNPEKFTKLNRYFFPFNLTLDNACLADYELILNAAVKSFEEDIAEKIITDEEEIQLHQFYIDNANNDSVIPFIFIDVKSFSEESEHSEINMLVEVTFFVNPDIEKPGI